MSDRGPISLWARIEAHLAAGERFALCQVVAAGGSVPRHAGARMLVFEDGRIDGSVGGGGSEQAIRRQAREVLASGGGPRLVELDLWYKKRGGLNSLCGGRVSVYIEPMGPRMHVLICGGGHVGHALAGILAIGGCHHTVVDDRPEYATGERFPRADEVLAGPAAEILAGRELARYTHIVLLGHSHEVDLALAREVLPRHPGWIGVIGSRAKAKELRARLVAAGLDDQQAARLRCPMGLDIGAETAAEIAIAIAAELIADGRRERTPGGL